MSLKYIIVSGGALICLTTFSGCAYPTKNIVQGGSSGAVYFEAFPENAQIILDGVPMGAVADFDGKERTLSVSPGSHTVQITDGSMLLYDKKIYVDRDSALKIIR
ncbi:hypothetical protein HY29_01815 [Hyphomonas beringensis]|uniref:PEGA domain-containing protein n=1 Tax=Hyphomonas beringensis TaxID=1280946 RepID=A0A062UB66_9PROT|nr:hypothetical protein [Hyphomonas beringensis]KCZ54968.1 hypothetical protein HY29_01815 [Hyphomonas beringensis]